MTGPSHLVAALAARYRIERELGAGGMATVYLADDLRHERKVAVKVLRSELSATIGAERFLREIRIAAQLQHPHILPLLESGEAGGFLYYVMPFVEGQSLRDRLNRQGELPVPEAVKLIAEIVDALAYAHGRGVVHRDIKPDNIMLSGRHALVMDFGVAKALSEASGKNQVTTAGVALGTPAYMAPEQAAADPLLDHRVDIYAVGVMAYELLAGRPPFVAATPQQVLAAQVTQVPEALSKHRPGISPALEQTVMRCLAKRPADRWQSAEELLLQLEPLLTPSGGMTPTGTRPIAAWRPGPSRLKWLIGASALGILAVFLWVWTQVSAGRIPTIVPDTRQLTVTGNADSPQISPDGTRMAFATRRCEPGGRCVFDLVVQDINGAGTVTLVQGALWLGRIEWTADQRYLAFEGDWGPGRWGVYLVPTLGGPSRFLGCCHGGLLGNSDTAVVGKLPTPTDSSEWVRFVTVADGIVHDSLPFPRRVGLQPSPDGRWIALTSLRVAIPTLYLMSRDGRIVDSMPWPGFQVAWTPDSRSVLGLVEQGGISNVVRYWLRGERFDPRGDTLIRQLASVGRWSVSRNGVFAYASGPTRNTVWALSRSSPSSMQFSSRALLTSTVRLVADLSPDGSRVLVGRVVPPELLRGQLSIIPFDSGAEIPMGPPFVLNDAFGWSWDGRGSAVLTNAFGGDSTQRIFALDPASSRRTLIGESLNSPVGQWTPLPSGGIAVIARSQKEIRLVGAGGHDSLIRVPQEVGRVESVAGSPDGTSLITVGWSPEDSIVVTSVSRQTGVFRRLAAFVAYYPGGQPYVLPDGTVQVPILESAETLIWYRVNLASGRSVRLGSLPYGPAYYTMSLNGLRIVALTFDHRTDVYEVRNFADILKR